MLELVPDGFVIDKFKNAILIFMIDLFGIFVAEYHLHASY